MHSFPSKRNLLNKTELTYLNKVRRKLHSKPELSGEEEWTASFITGELKKTDPDLIYTNLGGHGVAAIYGSGTEGPRVMFRAELDALRVEEEEEREYRSENSGQSHACGHDGHMTVLIGLARYLKENRPETGQVTLLFQPSEETGEGAGRIIDDPQFEKLQFDRGYAFHNLPGYEEGRLVIREGIFASASVGLVCRFKGESSHAAYPAQGRSPAKPVADMVHYLEKIGEPDINKENYAIATVTYIRVGEKAFGITPGRAEMGITLRAAGDDLLKIIREKIENKLSEVSRFSSVEVSIEENEPFAATVNDKFCTKIVKAAGSSAGMNLEIPEHPFPWSEDFGRFSSVSDIVLFGIGSGKDQPHLHAGNFDFNDALIEQVTELFTKIIEKEWKERST